MKSIKSWLLLLILYIAYLIIGGFIFHYTECPEELSNKNKTWEEKGQLASDLLQLEQKLNESDKFLIENVIHRVIGEDLDTKYNNKCHKWDFENSFFFSFTVVTTIGISIDVLCLYYPSSVTWVQLMLTNLLFNCQRKKH